MTNTLKSLSDIKFEEYINHKDTKMINSEFDVKEEVSETERGHIIVSQNGFIHENESGSKSDPNLVDEVRMSNTSFIQTTVKQETSSKFSEIRSIRKNESILMRDPCQVQDFNSSNEIGRAHV